MAPATASTATIGPRIGRSRRWTPGPRCSPSSKNTCGANGMATDDATRQHLLTMLQGNAGRRFEGAVKDFPIGSVNAYPPNVDYTPWHLVEHLRISLWDILDYIGNSNYKGLKHPDDYWPAQDAMADAATWQRSVEHYR